MVVVVESEDTSQIAVLRAHAALGIQQIAAMILTFQTHIHHVVLLLHVAPHHLTLTGTLVIHLHVLHDVVRQVVEHYLVVALEEVLAVECQVIHLLPVDVDVAVALQFCPRHLAHQSVEHRPFRQVEGRGVIHDGVTTIGNLHLRACDGHTVEIHILIDILPFLHQQAGQGELVVAGDVVQVVSHVGILVALACTFYNIFGVPCGHL